MSDESNVTLENEPVETQVVIKENERFTKDLPDKFFSELSIIADKLQTTTLILLSVMMSEAGVRADAHNPNGDASGLIQFMPKTLLNLGWTRGHEAFRKLPALDQLPFVYNYFKPYLGFLSNIAGVYTATFLPVLVSHAQDPDYVLCAKQGQLGWAYDANTVFDQNHDGKIQVNELERAVVRACVGPRWDEIRARATGQGIRTSNISAKPDLSTVYGLQRALNSLGFSVGNADGVFGPSTKSALVNFQTFAKLDADGVYGPISRKALADAISK